MNDADRMTETFYVPDLSSEEGGQRLERELAALNGVGRVRVDLEARHVTLTYRAPMTPSDIRAALARIGCPPVADLGTG